MFLIVLRIVILISAVEPVQGQTQAEEYRVKAAFLFHFAQLVDWPPEALGASNRPLILCTLGEELVPGTLESTMEGKQIGTRAIKVQHLQESDDLQACHVVFIVIRDKKHVAGILAGLKHTSALTVDEIENFTQMGGMIGFRLQEKKGPF
jgi:hypothetical protein